MQQSSRTIWFFLALLLGALVWFVSQNFAFGILVFVLFLVPLLITLYIPYAKDNPEHLWFKRKLYGWGWTPVTWQGWLITFLYIGILTGLALTLDEHSAPKEIAFMFVIPAVLLTATFLRIAYKKGERPRWQWGEDNVKHK